MGSSGVLRNVSKGGRGAPGDATSGGPPPEVFVSYAWKADDGLVARLKAALEADGLSVVLDRDPVAFKDSPTPIRRLQAGPRAIHPQGSSGAPWVGATGKELIG